jgi:hypothetical protein
MRLYDHLNFYTSRHYETKNDHEIFVNCLLSFWCFIPWFLMAFYWFDYIFVWINIKDLVSFGSIYRKDKHAFLYLHLNIVVKVKFLFYQVSKKIF